MLTDKILVVIPYLASGAQGRELEYAVAGWRRHFLEPFQIVIVGDYHPVVENGDDITFINCPRVTDIPGQYRPHLDHAHKFLTVMDAFPEVKSFIKVADDCYPVNDFDLSDVRFFKCVGASLDEFERTTVKCGEGFRLDKLKTRDALKARGYRNPRNFTTHLPMFYVCDWLRDLLNAFDCERESYVIEDLYFNIFFAGRVPFRLNLQHDNLKCGVYRPNPDYDVIRKAFTTKLWITNSPKGWTSQLDRMLAEYYGK